MSAQKTERLLNLVMCLLSTRAFLSKEQIRTAVPQYAECPSAEAFDRMFERDKDEVRDMGIPIETGSNSAWFEDEVGYRVDRAAYELPAVEFAPDELAVLSLASRVWQQAALAGPASRALLKLKAAGVEPDADAIVGVEPRIATNEPAFEALYAAVRDRRPVTFDYRAGSTRSTRPTTRRSLEPWGIVSWRGRWYVVGHDRDRADTRVFRLSRVQGDVRPAGRPGEVVVPEGTDIRAQVAAVMSDQPSQTATLCMRPGAGIGLRRRAAETREGVGTDGWDEVTVAFFDPEALAEEVAGFGPDVVAVAPPALRDAVVRRLTAALAANR